MSEPTSIKEVEDEIGLTCSPALDCSILSILWNGWDSIDGYEHSLLRFFTMHEARELRLVCREVKDAVDIAPFDDLKSPIGREGVPIQESLVLCRESFPQAVAATVWYRQDLVDADFAHFRGLYALDISGCTGITNAAFSHLRGIHTFIMDKCTDITEFSDLRGITTLHGVHMNDHPLIDAINYHYVTAEPSVCKVLQLISESDPMWIHATVEGCKTPLHFSSELGLDEVALRLLQCGADATAADDDGNTALHRAARYGNWAVARFLLKWGADVNARNKWGRTPRALAVASNHYFILSLLRSHGATD